MTLDMRKSRDLGDTIGEWLSLMPNELERDLIGLWQIIPTGIRGFGLSGADLEEFTRLALRAVLDRGAVPVKSPYLGPAEPELHYGENPEEIIENIVATWLASGVREPGMKDVWFALPEVAKEW